LIVAGKKLFPKGEFGLMEKSDSGVRIFYRFYPAFILDNLLSR
jgi:hypothetical protein